MSTKSPFAQNYSLESPVQRLSLVSSELWEGHEPFLLFFMPHSSVLKLELLLIETNCEVPPCITYFLSLTLPSLLSGEPNHLIGQQMHQLTLPLTFVKLLLIPGELAPFPCPSVYNLL